MTSNASTIDRNLALYFYFYAGITANGRSTTVGTRPKA